MWESVGCVVLIDVHNLLHTVIIVHCRMAYTCVTAGQCSEGSESLFTSDYDGK